MDDPNRITYFAATDSRGKRIPFGIKSEDRSKHMYIIGKTGMGKSTLLENMAIQDIRNGEGLAFIDPHGGTADKLLEYIPQHRIKDVVYFAPFDLDQPIAFNVMEDVGYDKRHLVVSGLMATFKKIWVDAWSARMEYILTNTLLALLEYPDATLLGVNRMYTDKAYRKKVVENVKDPVVKDFWVKEFAQYTDRFTQEATPAIQNKVGQFTSNPLIRNIIGQPKSSFDIRECMDQRKILIINLSKGQVGDTNAQLLGSMITTRIFLGAMSRADLSAADIRRLPHFYFYVDEFQNFANETFAEILSEARKYKLNLTIAHQYIEQMQEEVRDAVFGNVGTTVAFRVGPFDAETLETVFMPEFTKEDLVNLGPRQIYLSLMIDGVGSRPFSANTIPPIEPPPQIFKREVIEASRTQFGAPRQKIEENLMNELMATAGEPEPEPPARSYKPAGNGAGGGTSTNSGGNNRPAPRSSDDRPRKPENRGSGSSTPRPPREQPSKSTEDLKEILRKMTADAASSSKKAQQPAQKKKDTSLQGALDNVLQKTKKLPPPTHQLPAAAPEPQANYQPQSQPVQPQQSDQPPQAPAPQQQPAQAPQPYEVPEDVLRSVLKDG